MTHTATVDTTLKLSFSCVVTLQALSSRYSTKFPLQKCSYYFSLKRPRKLDYKKSKKVIFQVYCYETNTTHLEKYEKIKGIVFKSILFSFFLQKIKCKNDMKLNKTEILIVMSYFFLPIIKPI